jgi:primosomal replication protein N
MSKNQLQKTFSNRFFCRGKFAGTLNRRATPGGVLLEDFVLSVPSELPWKQKRMVNLTMTCFGDEVGVLKKFKTGDKMSVEGLIEDSGKDGLILVTIKIEKEID